MALGGFLAGMLVADSEYGHQLESDIEPFKSLLLGLFFMAVGMSTNLGLMNNQTSEVLVIVLGIVICKGAVLYGVGCIAKLKGRESLLLPICLSQGGEFGFILFTLAVGHNLMTTEIKDLLVLTVILSMLTTPLIHFVGEQIMQKISGKDDQPEYDNVELTDSKVIVAGLVGLAKLSPE